jgi:DNA replication protein DnaC
MTMKNDGKDVNDKLRERYPDIFAQSNSGGEKAPAQKVETVACRDCKEPYEKTTHFVMGIALELSGGRCPKCRQKMIDAETLKSEVKRQAAIREQKNIWWRESGVPEDYLVKSFETFDKSGHVKQFTRCVDYADKYPFLKPHGYPSLLLYSAKSWGTGKTHLACSICRRILERWKGEGAKWDEIDYKLTFQKRNPVYFISEPDIFGAIKATWNYTYEQKPLMPTEADIMNRLTSVPLLVIDDIGKEEVSDMKFVQRTLYTIIDTRYRKGLPMVLTANLSEDGLRLHLGGGVGNEASFSRLNSMLQNKPIQLEGEDYRQAGIKEKK